MLDILPDRNKETLEKWLDQFTLEQRSVVETVCIDMWEQYRQVAEAKLPKAKVVADRFHVQKNLNDAITKARRAIQHEADKKVREQLKGCRWLIVRNYADLKDDQKEKLHAMFAVSPALQLLHQLKEEFRAIFDLEDRCAAETALATWVDEVKASGLKHLDAFLTTLKNWGQYILNYFDGRWSNGFAEGVNNCLKLIKRRAYGYRNFDNFRLRVLVECGP